MEFLDVNFWHCKETSLGIIYGRLGDSQSFGRIRSKGDRALFGGKTTGQMKRRLNVPKSRSLADFLPTITIKAKDFANEITNFNIKRGDLRTETGVTREHVKNNQEVRKLLVKRNIKPEQLPPAEDIKKLERKLTSEQKKLITKAKPLDTTQDKSQSNK
jgi:DNA-damage-inducible protein D